MTRFLAFPAALILVLLAAGVASAHTAEPSCGGYLELHKGSRTADITRTDTNPDQLVYDDVDGNGTYAVVPGIYRVRWSDGYVVSHLEVKSCPQTPNPSPTPSPVPSAPTPSPSATPVPSPTPSRPTSSSTPIPTKSPPVSNEPSQSPNPTPSTPLSSSPAPLPETSTATDESLSYLGVVGVLAFLMVVIGTCGLLLRRLRS